MSDRPKRLPVPVEALRTLLEKLSEGVLHVDNDDRILYANPAICRMLGYEERELVGRIGIQTIIHPEDRSLILEKNLSRTRESSDEYEVRMVSRDGEVVWVEINGYPVRDGRGRVVGSMGVIHDISERRQARDALQLSQQRQKLIQKTLPVCFYTVRPTPDLPTTWVSEQVEALTGYPPSAFTDSSTFWTRNLHPEDRDSALKAYEAIFGTGKVNIEYRWRCADGTYRWFLDTGVLSENERGAPKELIGFWLDITGRKQAEESLRQESVFRQSVIARAAEGLCVCHPVPGAPFVNFTVWNDRMTEITGYTAEEINRLGWYQALYPDPEAQARAEERMARMRLGEDLQNEEWVIAHKDGSRRTITISTSLLDGKDNDSHVLAMIQDVTGRKRAEAERIEMERQLLHTQKLESLGILAGGIAHDFNNLLTAILGNMDYALLTIPAGTKARGSIESAMKASQRAADLTRQMLTFSGHGHFQIGDTDLNRLVEENTHLLRASIAKAVTLDHRPGRDLPPIRADVGQVQQVLMNLVVNASEAIGEKPGMITLTTGVRGFTTRELEGSRTAVKPSPGRFVFMEVKDNGAGMDAPTLSRLFEPFFTTRFQGRGLGMSAVLGIVQAHNGAIFVQSAPGTGTTACVAFPAAEAETPAFPGEGRRLEAFEDPVFAGTILLVDDEEIVRDCCAQSLRHLGFTVLEAVDGLEAVEIFREHAEEIACVLLDLTMPRMNGAAAFQEMRRIRPSVKVLLSSGYDERTASRKFREKDLAGFIQKPYHIQELQEKLWRVLSRNDAPGSE